MSSMCHIETIVGFSCINPFFYHNNMYTLPCVKFPSDTYCRITTLENMKFSTWVFVHIVMAKKGFIQLRPTIIFIGHIVDI